MRFLSYLLTTAVTCALIVLFIACGVYLGNHVAEAFTALTGALPGIGAVTEKLTVGLIPLCIWAGLSLLAD